jgi:hypothetical protein
MSPLKFRAVGNAGTVLARAHAQPGPARPGPGHLP